MIVKLPEGGSESVAVNVNVVVPLLPSFIATSLIENDGAAAAAAGRTPAERTAAASASNSHTLRPWWAPHFKVSRGFRTAASVLPAPSREPAAAHGDEPR